MPPRSTGGLIGGAKTVLEHSSFSTATAVPGRSPTTDLPQRELQEAVASLHLNNLYSDLTIASTTDKYPVHRAIVCPRSEFLAGWCRSNFSEVDARVLSLPEDDPFVVDTMIRCFYFLEYEVPVKQAQSQDGTGLPFDAKAFALAEQYFVQGLRTLPRKI
ncbi:hypothetical protein Micbo1qcDRAFT_227661 [Microdochium bolleyi]|uniref:BTB domain-containing protein n=1 Tax=Microdochium bolleyi TaxID=196109 RepID=A0A136IJ17_9PEZI|nr:hypothetical protein Micbo1qcDRAFT_227661 [Microdochium bolleyi]